MLSKLDSAATQWHKQGNYFTYRQQQIFYCTEGEGETLILLHGFPTSSFDWYKMWGVLKQKYNLVTLDYIGYGFSDKPANYDYSIKDNADIIESLLTRLNIQQYHLLAHDLGDSVAQELLARQKDKKENRILSCCLLNGGLFPETHRATATQKLLLGPLGFMIARMFTYKKFAASFSSVFPETSRPTKEELEALFGIILYKGGNKITHKLIQYIIERRVNRERWVTALQDTACPLLLIDGVADPVSGQHMVERYRELVPNSAVIEIENCGHYPQLEYPEKVLEHYLQFRNNLVKAQR